MGDIVLSESSLFWKLSVPPTKFDGYFCESVTREFELDPEPCSQQGHFLNCTFTENMINGVATIDIVIRRIEVKPTSSCSEGEGKGGESSSGGGDDISSSSSTQGQQGHQRAQQEQQRDRPQEQRQRQEQEQEQEHQCSPNSIPAVINYNTIAINTPKTLTPLMSMFLDDGMTSDNPIRVELEAEAIRYKGYYEFEIILSEKISSYMNPSLISCHRIIDSLYHGTVATSHPDTSTADIRFEFYSPSGSSSSLDTTLIPSMPLPVEEGSHPSEEYYHQQRQEVERGERHDGSAVAVVGAHWEKLKKYPFFADWIQREKQRQEEQRRRQLEEEWRVHQEHNQHQQQEQEQHCQHHQYLRPYNPWWHPGQSYGSPLSEYPTGEFEVPQQWQTWIEHPPPLHPMHYGEQQQFQRSEYHPREIPTYFQPLHSSATSLPTSSSSVPQHPGSCPSHHHQHRGPLTRSEPSHSSHSNSCPHHQVWRADSLPPIATTALRVPVTQIPLEAFQVILQYIYTGSIGLSKGQICDIDRYWNGNPEDCLTPQEDRNTLDEKDMSLLSSLSEYYQARERVEESRGGDGGRMDMKIALQPPITLPPLDPGFGDESENTGQQPQSQIQGQQSQGEDLHAGLDTLDRERPHTTIKDLSSTGGIHAFTSASVQTAWIPCSPCDRLKEVWDSQSPLITTGNLQQHPEGKRVTEEGQGGGSNSRQQGRGEGSDQMGGHCGRRGSGKERRAEERGTSAAKTFDPENEPSSSTSTISPPNHLLLSPHIRPTCSWESLLLFANLLGLQDLETVALKAIRYHYQMLASRALFNSNKIAEAAHNGFDRSNLDLQLVLEESILLSLLKLYQCPGFSVYPERAQVLRGGCGCDGNDDTGSGGRGGGGGGEDKGTNRSSGDPGGSGGGEVGGCTMEFKKVQPAGNTPLGLQTQSGERIRHQQEYHQQQQQTEKETREENKMGDEDDGRNQEEEHLGTIRSSSLYSSPTARTRRGAGGGTRPRRYSAYGQENEEQDRGGHQASRGNSSSHHASSAEGAHKPMQSIRTRTRSGSNTPDQSNTGSRSERSRAKHEREYGEDGKEEGEGRGEEELIAPSLEPFDHPECDDALEALCRDLRDRLLSMRNVMDHSRSA